MIGNGQRILRTIGLGIGGDADDPGAGVEAGEGAGTGEV